MLAPSRIAWMPAAPFAADWASSVPAGPIVYRIRAWQRTGERPRVIARAARPDEDGILDIGETARGRHRLREFWIRANGGSASHAAGRDYAAGEYGYDLASTFPPSTLRFDYVALPTKAHAEALELALLEHYRWSFKDRPPLNGSAGKYDKVAAWLASQGRVARGAGWLDLDGVLPASALLP